MPKFSVNELVLLQGYSGRKIIKIIEKRGDHIRYEVFLAENNGEWEEVGNSVQWKYDTHVFWSGLKKMPEEEQLNFLLKYA